MIRRGCIILLTLAVAACDDANTDGPLTDVSAPSSVSSAPTPPPSTAHRLLLSDTMYMFVGRRVLLDLVPVIHGVDVANADFETSDPSVVEVSSPIVANYSDANGSLGRGLEVTLSLLLPGTATVYVHLGSTVDSVTLTARPLPPIGDAVAVDSFTVAEYQATCAWACPYLVYAPLLRLREPTGTATVSVIGLQFTVSGHTTPMCSGGLGLGPGESADANRIFPYLWNNFLLFVSLDGVPFPDVPATATAIVRAADGTLSRLEVTGPIVHLPPNPVLPAPIANQEMWSC